MLCAIKPKYFHVKPQGLRCGDVKPHGSYGIYPYHSD